MNKTTGKQSSFIRNEVLFSFNAKSIRVFREESKTETYFLQQYWILTVDMATKNIVLLLVLIIVLNSFFYETTAFKESSSESTKKSERNVYVLFIYLFIFDQL